MLFWNKLIEYKEIPEKIPEFPEIWHKSPEIPELSKWLGIAISIAGGSNGSRGGGAGSPPPNPPHFNLYSLIFGSYGDLILNSISLY